ncbi:MAG: ATP-binding protein [Spirochaetia bacterium]
MKALTVISGKGGTGKTSLAASFAVLAESPVAADCDVDAADLFLLLSPDVQESNDFYGGREAVIRKEDCISCGGCLSHCRYGAVVMNGESVFDADFVIDPHLCEGCGVCVRFCPVKAIDFPEALSGQWMISRSRSGPMVHARLFAAAENSGKLVSIVRMESEKIARADGHDLIIIDGPPGIGCPVIASITGTDLVLAVTEPTLSGEHDLKRVLSLANHFSIPSAVCVNKWDLNPEITLRIEQAASAQGAGIAGRVRYDSGVTRAQSDGLTPVETECPAGQDIRKCWETVLNGFLKEKQTSE